MTSGRGLVPARRAWPLWGLIAAAFALRTAALAGAAWIPCLQDECSYASLAAALAEGRGFLSHARHFWPPGYIVFLAGHFAVGGGTLSAKATQVVLSTLLVPLVYLLGLRAGMHWGERAGRRAGLLAAAFIAFDPTLIAFSHYLWPETLFLPLFTSALLLVLAVNDSPSWKLAAASGALFGVAALVKVLALYLVPILAVWLLARRGGAVLERRRAAAVLVATMLGVIAPWTVRNALVLHRFVPVETTSGKNMVRGNNPYAPSNWDWGALRQTPALLDAGCKERNFADLDNCLKRRALAEIVANPGRFLRNAGTKIADLFNPTSFLVRHLRIGVYGRWPKVLTDGLVVVVALFNAAMMAFAVVGWARSPSSPERQVTVFTVIYIVAVHVATFGMSRFRLPLAPLLAAGAAIAFTTPLSWTELRRAAGRAVLATLLIVGLIVCWARRIDGLFYEPPAGAALPSWGPEGPGNEE